MLLKIIFKHFVYMICLSIALLWAFFYIALPRITHQGQVVQVPDLTGLPIQLLEEVISKSHLQYAITDNNYYTEQQPPSTVIQQFPLAGTYVKKNRKIFITLNAERPPLIAMPNLIEGSIKHAQLLLKNQGLKIGNIKFIPDITKNTVLEQWYKGNPISAGKLVNKGSAIDLVVGAGLGEQIIEIPNLLNKPLEEANLILLEHGIRIGVVHFIKIKSAPIGTVLRQKPIPGTRVRIGTSINLWIVKL